MSTTTFTGNDLFWAMAGIIGFLLVAVWKLAGAISRQRQAATAVLADPRGQALVEPFESAAPLRARASRAPARRVSGGRLLASAALIDAVLIVVVLWAADKVLHFRLHGASGTASPKPKVPAAPRPAPVVTHPAPRVPPAAVQAAHSWLTTFLTAVAHAARSIPLGPAVLLVVAGLLPVAFALRRRRVRHP
jgi:hypothetical protein